MIFNSIHGSTPQTACFYFFFPFFLFEQTDTLFREQMKKFKVVFSWHHSLAIGAAKTLNIFWSTRLKFRVKKTKIKKTHRNIVTEKKTWRIWRTSLARVDSHHLKIKCTNVALTRTLYKHVRVHIFFISTQWNDGELVWLKCLSNSFTLLSWRR